MPLSKILSEGLLVPILNGIRGPKFLSPLDGRACGTVKMSVSALSSQISQEVGFDVPSQEGL